MTVYLVTYDLKTPGQKYSNVHEAIKGCGAWCHPLESTWLVDTHLSAQQIVDRVRLPMDDNDLVLVTKFTSDNAGWFSKTAWEWIDARYLSAA